TWETRNYNSEATLNQALYVGASFVIFLREIYGAQSHAAFYQSWRATSDFNLSFELTFGLNLAGLTQQWQDWIVNNNTVVSPGITDTTVAEVELPPPPEPLPEGLARVNIYLLNFRTGPTEDHDVLYTLRAGQLLLPIGRNESGEWILAELPDGTQGWLLAEFLDYDESIENLTVSLFY
ncbi:MAG TPA: hypothetical protein VJZ27_06480, partial [Aggregatilineales bacterium]|nr:hypothetical protein [Aggregatilineales bacterium]